MKKSTLFTGVSMLALALTVAVGISLFPAKTVKADGDVEINETNFPDENFRKCLKEEDYGKDGVLTVSEIKSIKTIDVRGKDIKDLKGIEYFTCLEELDCQDNGLTSLEVNKNTALKDLYCSNNKLSSLDVSMLSSLTKLGCGRNPLGVVDVSENTSLVELYCYNCMLSSLDVSKNTALTKLICSNDSYLGDNGGIYNVLTTLDVSNCKELKVLDCENIGLSKLIIKGCSKLEDIDCDGNNLKKLDVSGSPKVKFLYCSKNKLKELNLGVNPEIYWLHCEDNKLNELDISKCSKLVYLYKTSYEYAGDDIVYYQIGEEPKNWDADDGDPPDFVIKSEMYLDVYTKLIYKSEDVKLDKNEANVVVGKTLSLKVSIKDDSLNAEWTSSDNNVATVDKNGKVKAKKAGRVCITVNAGGMVDDCIVTVLYKDVTNSKDFWFEPTNYLTAYNIVKGYDKQTKFKPANDCTRAQMVTFLYRLSGNRGGFPTGGKFDDVKEKDYFFEAVYWAYARGITTGVSKTKFNPQGVCTRAQTVTFLWRMAGKPEPKAKTCKFSDVKKNDYFYQPVIWASEKGVVAGYKDGTFKPQGKCLRRQMVTFLYKYDKFVNPDLEWPCHYDPLPQR